MNYLSLLAEKWFQPYCELGGCWTPHQIFFNLFLSLSLLSLSLPSSVYEQRGEYIYYTQGNYWSMEELVANCSWLIDPEALTPRSVTKSWEESCVASSCFSCLNCVLKQGVFCVLIQTHPPFSKKIVCIYLFKQGFSVYWKFWVKF